MPAQDDAVALARALVEGADEKKATNPTILDVADVLTVVDCFAMVTTANERQLRAVTDAAEERAREALERKPLRREGTPASGWVLLDYGDVVLHVFDREQREFYDLDRLWGDVPSVDPALPTLDS